MTPTYGSVCSGIEAASLAWRSLGWQPAWFSEIEPFPSAVLAYHWPHVTNLGDMTKIAAGIRAGKIHAPDILVGGTPCQAFSVAGLRGGLADARGQLTLAYMELANAIDRKRHQSGKPATVLVWENVPGVLNDKTNAFGCFLGGLAGEECPLEPAGGRWTNAGAVYGPQRAIAWRVLDAQFVGVAQRRQRVFVVASARQDFDPGKVLFEFDGLRRDIAPSREAGKVVAALTAGGVGTCGADDNQGQAGHLIPHKAYRMTAFGEYADDETASTCKARDWKDATDLAVCVTGDITHTLQAEGCDASEDGTGRGTPITLAFNWQAGGNTSGTLGANEHVTGALQCNQTPAIAFSSKDYGGDATAELSPTLRSGNSSSANQNGGQPPAVVYSLCDASGRDKEQNGRGWSDQGVSYTLDTITQQGVAVCLQHAQIGRADHAGPQGKGYLEDLAFTQDSRADADAVQYGMYVRRLMPVECERLQGMPDDHTKIPWRAKPAEQCPDSPRYKAIGNSMAVPCMTWIGERIRREAF
ncbi:DNA cytosine methyltransferase [Rahnella aceris]|uniref:DNA cytosine methyltransferase n=1 Tax=Rahnella sp. (strain Y9602) TaxID=2703885 RepID=UPI001C277BA0|nr:DNA cytosine methyltransferase [Rahnella aceris]MBU9866792.1 DNA cytosine methyltransferase [Rahnella aceris]